MKKSKIIIPAAAILALSVGASVTGTVAWFTSSRTATVKASVFESKALETNLTVKSTKLVGMTTVDTSAATTSTITVDGYLTHGSYNAAANNAGELYVANFNDDGTVDGYVSKGTVANAATNAEAPTVETHSTWWAGKTDDTTAKNIWYGVAWTMDFTASHTVDDTMSLFVDYSSTEFSDANTGTGAKTMPGLRIALMTATNVRVIGGEEETNHVISGTLTGKFGTDIYHVAKETSKKASDRGDFSEHTGLLGAMAPATGKTSSTLTVTAVAWFEGESDVVVSSSLMSQVSASLSFYARINK